jgi:hypothetical protein
VSVAQYDGCNECGGHGIYASFVMTTVAATDPSRPPWPTSPSPGWASGVDRLTSLPNGSPLGLQPKASNGDLGSRLRPLRRRRGGGGGAESRAAAAALGGACSSQADTDYCNTCFSAPAPPAASAAECCDLCAAATPDACWCAVFDPDDATCYFKPRANVSAPISKAGVTAVWPAGRGPPPPPPPPGPQPRSNIESHGPYLHGSGMPSVDSIGVEAAPSVLPHLYPAYDIGPRFNGTFTSEFGCTAFSSFESMSATLAPEHWSLHGGAAFDECTPSGFFQRCRGGNVMAQRNYMADSIISQHFGNMSRPDEVGEAPFARDLYFSMLAQAFVVSSEVQLMRSHNHWGVMLWQASRGIARAREREREGEGEQAREGRLAAALGSAHARDEHTGFRPAAALARDEHADCRLSATSTRRRSRR